MRPRAYSAAKGFGLPSCESGFRIRTRASPFFEAKPALEAAQFVEPDLLLTDVAMSDLDGIELAGRLTDRCPACKVLLFSGRATTASLLEDGRAASHSFEVLGKPLHPNDLLA
jgi:CheY-like chemotaxis protein